MRIQLVTVDSHLHTLKNAAVDKKALGKRIEYLRREKFGTQKKLAAAANVTPNTVRGLEKGTLDTRGPQMHRIFKALGTTLEKLVSGDEVKATDPLYRRLRREHLLIAHEYKDAESDVRDRVRVLLERGERDQAIRILKLPADVQASIEALITESENRLREDETRQRRREDQKSS